MSSIGHAIQERTSEVRERWSSTRLAAALHALRARLERSLLWELLRSELAYDEAISISPVLVSVLTGLVAVVMLFVCDDLSDYALRFRMQMLASAVIVLAALPFPLLNERPALFRWFLLFEWLILVILAEGWLGLAGGLAFGFVPVVLANLMINRAAGLGTLLVCIGGAIWMHSDSGPIRASTSLGLSLTILLLCEVLVYAIHRRLQQMSDWVEDQYQLARAMQQQALSDRIELSHAVEDLGQANEQMQRLNRVAQGLRQTAEEALAAKASFVANVSHELRTPLNMITGYIDMITEVPEAYGDVPVALLADLSVVHRNSTHLSSLIDDVLDLSQIEQDEMALSKERVHFEEILEAAIEAVRPLYRAKGLYLRKDIAEGLPSLFCDRTRMREVVLNILSNAGRFTEEGGVAVKVRLRDGGLECAITDTGPGISQKNLGRLFEPFHQADGTIRRRYGGSGLGLAISKRFIELHEGQISVESELGVGTTFSFRLPLGQTVTPGTEGWLRWTTPQWEFLQRTRPSAAPSVRARPRYVVVEKGGGLARLLARYAEDAEIIVHEALDEALDDVSDAPAEALLINTMAVGAMLERLREVDLPHSVPALICSVPGPQQTANSLGVEGYLVKPISRHVLLEALDELHLEGNTVLIVDDQREAVRLFRRILSSSPRDYRVLRAHDGVEGLRVMREQRPDVLLVDLSMPRMDGFELLEERGRDPELARIPALVISARDPMGQPIVSRALAVTRGGGLSTHHLLATIEGVSQMLTPSRGSDGPAPARGSRD